MRKAYLLVYSSTLGTRDEVKSYLTSIPQIKTWRYEMPYSFFLISEEDANTLVKLIKTASAAKGEDTRFFITEIPETNRQGWITPSSWYFIKNKTVKPKE